jgi:SAM-dependent methyltransferase
LQNWLKTPPGQYLLNWESAQFERVVADIFGYHALQLGLPSLKGLSANRMPHRWIASPFVSDSDNSIAINKVATQANNTLVKVQNIDFFTDFEALPFAENSLDLLILPHSLELSHDPHATLREAERVLVPEGKLIICGFNPLSLWGLKQKRSHLYQRLNLGDLYLPEAGEFIGYRRLRDWLGLLNFDVEPGHFGCYRPAVRSDGMLQRFGWMDKVGARFWPIFGAVYFVVAVKRVPGVRMIRSARKLPRVTSNAPVSIANKAINTLAKAKQ